MALNTIWGVVKWIVYAILGMVVIDVIPFLNAQGIETLEMFNGVENTIKTFTALGGLVYFAKNLYAYVFIELPYKKKKYHLETRIMEEDLESKAYDNGKIEDETKKKIKTKQYGKTVIFEGLKHIF